MNLVEEIQNLLHHGPNYSLPVLLEELQSVINRHTFNADTVKTDLIEVEFLDEVKSMVAYDNVLLYFGKTLRDLKLVMLDESLREHTILIKYRAPRKLVVTSVTLPHSPLQDREYNSLEEIILCFRKHLSSLSGYFYELERIDRFCTIMEPAEPTFKDDYRRILLDERIWLHLEVTPDGLANNIHLVGQSELWSNKLQQGLLSWDHDKDIIENIMTVFDLVNFPVGSRKSSTTTTSDDKPIAKKTLCSICLCAGLPDSPGVPLPLCQNPTCGVYFHRNCLFQWLVACGGGRPPPFGVATGSCPACLDTIACCERDD